jgi:hypothetical protein
MVLHDGSTNLNFNDISYCFQNKTLVATVYRFVCLVLEQLSFVTGIGVLIIYMLTAELIIDQHPAPQAAPSPAPSNGLSVTHRCNAPAR